MPPKSTATLRKKTRHQRLVQQRHLRQAAQERENAPDLQTVDGQIRQIMPVALEDTYEFVAHDKSGAKRRTCVIS